VIRKEKEVDVWGGGKGCTQGTQFLLLKPAAAETVNEKRPYVNVEANELIPKKERFQVEFFRTRKGEESRFR